MNRKIAFGLLILLAISSCQVKEIITDNTQEPLPEAKVFTAIIDDSTSPETRTSLDGSGNVLWKLGDQVSIFAASTVNEQYQVSDDSDGKTAATLNKLGGSGFVAGTEIDNNVAFYPYASTAAIAKSGGSYIISDIELPATQNYAEGSFGNGAFPMTAVTNTTADMNLKFKNVLGGLKLQLKGTATITSITVTGNNNEILCGDADVTVAYGSTPSISLTDASAKTVTLDCGAGVTLDTETATSFIIALPPMTMTGGFTVVVTDSESKQMEISTSKSQTIIRSSLLKMPVVNYVGVPIPELQYVDLGLSVKWALYNLKESGFVSSPEQNGGYYAWGEVEPYYEEGYDQSNSPEWKSGKENGYALASYRWCNGTSDTFTKYNSDPAIGIVDNKTILDSEDDAAHYTLGGSWRIPTDVEWMELRNNCTWTWTNNYEGTGVEGRIVTSNVSGYTDKSIFIPAAGFRANTTLYAVGIYGYYWSSSRSTSNSALAYHGFIDSGGYSASGSTGRASTGLSIRPVYGERLSVSGVSLSASSMTLEVGEKVNLIATVSPAQAQDKRVVWSSSDPSVATVDQYGVISAVAIGFSTISAITNDGGYEDDCVVTVVLDSDSSNIREPEAVDLGLTVKWASFNLGANNPEEYGGYYSWGETELKGTYDEATYLYGSNYSLTKYCPSDKTNHWGGAGSPDNKTDLADYDYVDDTARKKLGGLWRIPTDSEWTELQDNCIWEWVCLSGVYGRKITSKIAGYTDRWIFLPAAGYRHGENLIGTEVSGFYWKSSLQTDCPFNAEYVSFNSSSVSESVMYRFRGLPIRPVTE